MSAVHRTRIAIVRAKKSLPVNKEYVPITAIHRIIISSAYHGFHCQIEFSVPINIRSGHDHNGQFSMRVPYRLIKRFVGPGQFIDGHCVVVVIHNEHAHLQ